MRDDTDNKEWSPLESQVAAALRTKRAQPSAACLQPDAFFALVELDEKAPGYALQMEHVAACDFCSREYLQLRADLLEVERLRAASKRASDLMPAANNPLMPNPKAQTPPARVAEQPSTKAVARGLEWPPVVWLQRLIAPGVLVPALGASVLAALLLLGRSRALQHENERLARRLQQATQQRIALQKERENTPSTAAVPSMPDGHAPGSTPSQGVVWRNRLATSEKKLRTQERKGTQLARQLAQSEALRKQQEKQFEAAGLPHKILPQNIPERSVPFDVRSDEPLSPTADLNLAIRQALHILQVSPQSLAELQTDFLPLRGGETGEIQAIELLSPVATLVRQKAVEFRWRPIEGASHYKLGWSDGRTYTEHLLPDVNTFRSPQALAPGKTYTWELVAFRGDESKEFARASARFRMWDVAKVNKLTPIIRLIKAQVLAPHRAWQCGEIYRQVGLLEEAEAAYRAVEAASPHFKQAQARLRELDVRRHAHP